MYLPLRRTVYIHLLGVGIVVTSILLDGGISHDTGIAMAIGVVVLLDAQSLPAVAEPGQIELVVGSVTAGGIRQGQFIKLCFATALTTSGGVQYLVGGRSGAQAALLGSALALSAIANEFEIRTLQRRLDASRSL